MAAAAPSISSISAGVFMFVGRLTTTTPSRSRRKSFISFSIINFLHNSREGRRVLATLGFPCKLPPTSHVDEVGPFDFLHLPLLSQRRQTRGPARNIVNDAAFLGPRWPVSKKQENLPSII